ncbi:MAG TPA: hypothetical protein DHV44_08245 [Providencia sp.]|nr:hypothetical protein [Providencia sp.]
MNPLYLNNCWKLHLQRARQFVKAGGRLGSVTKESVNHLWAMITAFTNATSMKMRLQELACSLSYFTLIFINNKHSKFRLYLRLNMGLITISSIFD